MTPRWTASVETRKTSPGAIGIGTILVQRARFIGRSLEFAFEVVAYEPNYSITAAATTRMLALEGARIVDPIGDSTRVTVVVGGKARRVSRLVERPRAAIGAYQLRAQLNQLKQLMEVHE